MNDGRETKEPVQFISPMHKALGNRTVWDYLATTGNILMFFLGFVMLGMPLIKKNAVVISENLAKIAKGVFKQPVAQDKKAQLLQILSSHELFAIKIKKFTMLTLLLSGVNFYQQAVNAKQPSLVVNALARDLITIVGMKTGSDFVFSLLALVGMFFGMGKYNDLKNNLHPERRRDWDFARLTRFLPWHSRQKAQENRTGTGLTLSQELHSFGQYVWADTRYLFSFRPWHNLKRLFRKGNSQQELAIEIQPITSQTITIAWAISALGMALKNQRVRQWAGFIEMLGVTLGGLNYLSRAWQNRSGLDGKLMLIGTPLGTLGSAFAAQYTTRFLFMNGFSKIGASMMVKSFELNSKHFRGQVEELEWLAIQARLHPELTAHNVVTHFHTHPKEQRILVKRIGKERFDYILKLLKQAEQQARQGVTLAEFLAPALEKIDEPIFRKKSEIPADKHRQKKAYA